MRLDEKELATAFAKASLSNIPVVGGVLAETIGALAQTDTNDAIAARYKQLANAITRIAPADLQDGISEILGTTTYERLKGKLDLLYFENGVSADKACEVFICAWDAGGFPEFLSLSDPDRLSILLYAIGRIANLRNESQVRGTPYISLESTEKVIRNLYVTLSELNQGGLRYSDLAAIFLCLSNFQFDAKRYQEAAISLIDKRGQIYLSHPSQRNAL